MLIYNFDLFLEYTAMTQLTCLHWNSSSVLAPYSGQRERAARGIMDDGVLSGIGDVDTCGMGALFFVGDSVFGRGSLLTGGGCWWFHSISVVSTLLGFISGSMAFGGVDVISMALHALLIGSSQRSTMQ